jgi:Ca2+-binding RTX toxin-like protein
MAFIIGTDGNDIRQGTNAPDIMLGLGGNDILRGLGGSDTLSGGAGDDILAPGTGAADLASGGAGNDTVDYSELAEEVSIDLAAGRVTFPRLPATVFHTLSSIENANGAGFDDEIRGNNEKNILRGLGGNDRIFGLGGDDEILGGIGDDTLDGGIGDDTLDGGAGNDLMIGGVGNDTYIVDSLGDVVTEQVNAGIDTVNSSVSYTLSAHVENLILTESENLNGAGNDLNNTIIGNSGNNLLQGLGGNDSLEGGAGDDTLDGGVGNDTMIGGVGNDTYIVDSLGDVVTELPNEGIDTVRASVSYALGANIENLILTGSENINGTGNELNNVITGNAGVNMLNGADGNDTLIGGQGRDRMMGGKGADRFVFTAPRDGVDRIMDFNRREGDKLVFLNQGFEGSEGFEGLRLGQLRRNQFHVGKRAESGRHRFIYNESRGILFYDADGKGGAGQVRIATFADKPALRASDIIVAASPF